MLNRFVWLVSFLVFKFDIRDIGSLFFCILFIILLYNIFCFVYDDFDFGFGGFRYFGFLSVKWFVNFCG